MFTADEVVEPVANFGDLLPLVEQDCALLPYRKGVVGLVNTMVMSDGANADESMRDRATAAIKVLIKAFEDLTDAGQVDVPNEHTEVFIAVYGWWAWISRNSKLVLLAYDADLAHESAPNVRTILEHSLVMQWDADIGQDALAALAVMDSERRRVFIDELDAAGWQVQAEVTPPQPASHPLKGKIKNFQELCISYGARSLYVPYRMLSTHIHPTAKGASAYVDAGQLASYPVHGTADGNLALIAVTLIQAALTINNLLQNDALTAAIADARERLGAEIDRPQLA